MCHAEVPEGASAVEGVVSEDVEVAAADGSAMPAVVAWPDDAPAKGRIVIAHDVYGASPFYEDLTARVASHGYTVILPSLFFRQGEIAEKSRNLARERRSRFDEVLAIDDLEASLDHLGAAGAGASTASMGFCMGGTLVLDLAARRRGIATVCFYGFPAPNNAPRGRMAPAPLDIIDDISGPIVGFWGDQDHLVGLDNVDEFSRQLSARGVEHEFEVYPEVGHGFMAASKFDPKHEAYAAASDAWSRTVTFLDTHLG